MNYQIEGLSAIEILDSRGRPTLKVHCSLSDAASGSASVPSGASTGKAEAVELRDEEPNRYAGLGCRMAAASVNEQLQPALRGKAFSSPSEFDRALVDLDGTPNKARLGANAILGASLAFARACASQDGLALYEYFAIMAGQSAVHLPRPFINLFSGGKHAGGQVDIQDVQIIPVSAGSIDEILATTYAVFQAGVEITRKDYQMRLLRADEGGLAPTFPTAEAMLETAVEAIHLAGFQPGEEILLAVDVAASQFYRDGKYQFAGEILDGDELTARWLRWLEDYPIASLEDPLAEEDWPHWSELSKQAAGKCLLIGDDLLCTNPARIEHAIKTGAASGLLLKVNQVGTLSEALEAFHLARSAGWKVIASARSGDTEDDWLADLSVGWSTEYIKVGSITQSERLAKYNRLLELEQLAGLRLQRWER